MCGFYFRYAVGLLKGWYDEMKRCGFKKIKSSMFFTYFGLPQCQWGFAYWPIHWINPIGKKELSNRQKVLYTSEFSDWLLRKKQWKNFWPCHDTLWCDVSSIYLRLRSLERNNKLLKSIYMTVVVITDISLAYNYVFKNYGSKIPIRKKSVCF